MENSPPLAPAAAAQATRPDPVHRPEDPATMRPPSPPRPPVAFPTLDSLAAFLRPRLPPGAPASWGAVPGTKTLANLFLELAVGDCALHAPADARRGCRGARLVETRQLLSDGTVRRRGLRPLSEKMRPGESPEAAAARAVREELGARARVRILGGDGARVEERESASYPGLPARYVLHAVDAKVVDGVPEDGEFETEETGEDDGDAGAITVKRHYWDWIDDDDDDGDSERKEVAAAGALAH
ncbi:unnamed protein product [Miscanthus lutarioriparius]|uniref:Nudix hydrolase domain-containing protein n=1 Tax=Miscanthus lutarioriparius TaxID=422564 RepID=A0A811RZF4_9POAL|nr:unnamed protein product [Miscanthus lutarioriparius]